MKRRGKMWLLLILISLFFIQSDVTLAETDKPVEQFGVNAIIPDNQIDKEKTFFDLMMKPNQTQELVINVTNKGNTPIKVSVAANNAYTTDSGLIAYDKKDTTGLINADPEFSSLSRVDTPTIELKPGEVKPAKINLAMPESEFNGLVLGGIVITQILEDNKPLLKEGVKTKQSIVTGVRLSMTDKKVTSEMELVNVSGSEKDGGHIEVILNNKTATIISNIQMITKIYPENDPEDLLVENTQTNLKMAPNSIFTLSLPLINEHLNAGSYRLISEVTSKEGKWTFEKIFHLSAEIGNKEAKEPEFSTKGKFWLVVGVIVTMLIVVTHVYVYITKNKKKNKSVNRKRVKRVKNKIK